MQLACVQKYPHKYPQLDHLPPIFEEEITSEMLEAGNEACFYYVENIHPDGLAVKVRCAMRAAANELV